MEQKTNLQKIELQEALRLLYSNVIASSFVSVLISTSLVFGFGFDDTEHHDHKVIWWSVLMTLLALRQIDAMLFQKKASLENQNPTPQKDLWRFSSLAIMVTGLWSVYGLYFFPFSSPDELTITIILICGMAAGGANLWSAHKLTAIICVLIMLGPFSLLLMTSDDSYQHLLGIIGLTYTFVMVVSAHKTSSFTQNAIRLKNQNVELLEDMEKKVERRTQEIYRLSNIDPLTELFNRSAFLKELNLTVSKNASTSLALLFIDLDGFKKINDSMGHEVGDKVIKETASRIAVLCEGLLPICRWGGDEFLVVRHFDSHEQINHFAQQLIDTIGQPHTIEQFNKTWVGATIGIALYPEHGRHHDLLIQNADMAMYHQKRLEKGQVGHFNESLRMHLIRERLLSDRLSTAIEENSLRLVFQPIIESQTGKVAGIEALLRWKLDGQEVNPVEFIPIAEHYGMIKNIGLWVLEKACQQVLTLSKSLQPPTVSINVSVIQLQTNDFANHVQALLTRLQFNPNLLLIEITESVFASDEKSLLKQVKSLQEMGVKVSIDDFGTGYSSLSSMQNLGGDIVKIDRSFIEKLESSGFSIINAVLQIAQSMNYKVVAEGVETEQQANKLKAMGVHFLQGYHLCRPLETNQLADYLTHHA